VREKNSNYFGDFKYDKKAGFGVEVYYANEDIYKGFFENDSKDGMGIYSNQKNNFK
jgi:hypothetical protein